MKMVCDFLNYQTVRSQSAELDRGGGKLSSGKLKLNRPHTIFKNKYLALNVELLHVTL